MISVLVAASSVVVRAGLESLARANPGVEVVGSTGLGSELQRKAADLGPDVILAETDAPAAEFLQYAGTTPIVLLTEENALGLLRSGARAVLASGASAREIGAALEAVAAGLMVMHPEAIETAITSHAVSADHAPVSQTALSNREIEVLRMLAEGIANKEIAYRMGISEHTVKFHVASLFQKLNATSRTEAVTLGIRQGLIFL